MRGCSVNDLEETLHSTDIPSFCTLTLKRPRNRLWGFEFSDLHLIDEITTSTRSAGSRALLSRKRFAPSSIFFSQ